MNLSQIFVVLYIFEGHPRGSFINHMIILVLYKLQQYDNTTSEKKKTRVQLKLQSE